MSSNLPQQPNPSSINILRPIYRSIYEKCLPPGGKFINKG